MKRVYFIILLALTGCSLGHTQYFPAYRPVMTQGNMVDEYALTRLSVGMTKTEVQMLLGTPVVTDPFHVNRWDYVYFVTHNAQLRQRKNLTLIFKADFLESIQSSDAAL